MAILFGHLIVVLMMILWSSYEVELNVTKKALHEMRVEFKKVKSENLKAYSNADKAIKENEKIEKVNKEK